LSEFLAVDVEGNHVKGLCMDTKGRRLLVALASNQLYELAVDSW
jgi:hypothetical protein